MLVAGNVLKMVAKQVWPWAAAQAEPPRSKIEKIARRAVPGAAEPSKWSAALGRWTSAKSAAMPPSVRSGQPQATRHYSSSAGLCSTTT